jgi:NAD+--asparagine ADP-ribosyltransferase
MIALVVQNARVRHAKSVGTLPDGEIDDLDHLGRTLDQAIADAVLTAYVRESVIDWVLGGPS